MDSIDPFLLWTHRERDQVSVLTLFGRVTLVWPFLVKTQLGRNTPNIKGLPRRTCPSSLCLFTRTRGHLYIVSKHEKKVSKVKLWERNVCLGLVSESHLSMIKHWPMESLMKPLQSLGRWRPLIAIIAVMKLTIRSCLRERARCHRNQEHAEDSSWWKSWNKVLTLNLSFWFGEQFTKNGNQPQTILAKL